MAAKMDFLQAVEALREQIAAVKEEISWLDTSPVPADDLKAAVGEWVRAQGNVDTYSRMDCALRAMTAPQARDRAAAGNEMLVTSTRSTVLEGSFVPTAPVSLAPALCWLLGEAEMTRLLHAKIDALEYTPGPPMAERQPRRVALVKELCRLELAEEAAICAAEKASVSIGRRADADPAAVLAYDPAGKMRDSGPQAAYATPHVDRAAPAGEASAAVAPGSASSSLPPAPASAVASFASRMGNAMSRLVR